MKTLGVIGGLGPMATAYYMQLVTSMTDAARDQDHLHMILYSRPDTPDRTGYILGRCPDNPLPVMLESGRELARQGVGCIAIPCNTAHYFHADLERELGVPILHMIRDTASELRAHGIQTAGVMATDGTIQTGLYQKELERQGIRCVTPSPEGQAKVMHLIYENVKAGRPVEIGLFHEVKAELESLGAEAHLMACTELSVIKNQFDLGPGVLDALEVLARSAVIACEAPLRQDYTDLITQ